MTAGAWWLGALRRAPPNRLKNPADFGVDAPLPEGVAGMDDDKAEPSVEMLR